MNGSTNETFTNITTPGCKAPIPNANHSFRTQFWFYGSLVMVIFGLLANCIVFSIMITVYRKFTTLINFTIISFTCCDLINCFLLLSAFTSLFLYNFRPNNIPCPENFTKGLDLVINLLTYASAFFLVELNCARLMQFCRPMENKVSETKCWQKMTLVVMNLAVASGIMFGYSNHGSNVFLSASLIIVAILLVISVAIGWYIKQALSDQNLQKTHSSRNRRGGKSTQISRRKFGRFVFFTTGWTLLCIIPYALAFTVSAIDFDIVQRHRFLFRIFTDFFRLVNPVFNPVVTVFLLLTIYPSETKKCLLFLRRKCCCAEEGRQKNRSRQSTLLMTSLSNSLKRQTLG